MFKVYKDAREQNVAKDFSLQTYYLSKEKLAVA